MDRRPREHATPRVDRLLAGLGRRLRLAVLCHGIGTLLGVLSLWLAWTYVADYGLRVPGPVRVGHGLVWVLLGGLFLWRALLRPLKRIPGREGLALLFERAYPELRELLISALQFQARGAREGDPQRVARVLAEAERRAASLSPTPILDASHPRRRLLVGCLASLFVVLFALQRPDHFEILLNRMLGGSMGWPQATHLTIALPGIEGRLESGPDGERILARVARGTDVPIVVRAEGVVPNDVRLVFEDRQDLLLNRSGGDSFRTLLRSLQEGIRFHATGGDDLDGRPSVEVEVLEPPDVTGIAFAVRPPSYSGYPERLVFAPEVQVLAGSQVRVHVRAAPAEARGVARLLPGERTVALESLAFPRDDAAADDAPASTAPSTGHGLSFATTVEESLGFRIELEDGSGLTNPDPALFRITAVEDRAPEVHVLAPARSDFEVVLGGAIPLRVRAEDDLGVDSLHWRVVAHPAPDRGVLLSEGELTLVDVSSAEDARRSAGEARPRHTTLGTLLLEVNDLATEELPVAVDQRYVLHVTARDNRAPLPNEQEALPIRARVVTPEELLRRMQERLARARLDTVRLSNLQVEKQRRVEELIDALDGDGADGSEAVAMAAALSGQRRVLGDAEAVARDLAAVAEDILYARLDEKAGALLEYYHRRASGSAELRFRSEPWRALAAADAAGQLGSGGFASNLAQLVGLALEIAEDHARAAARALDDAERVVDAGQRIESLVRGVELQQRCLARIEDLLAELAEWDNFQNVLALTRDILNRQKALRDRTQRFATGK